MTNLMFYQAVPTVNNSAANKYQIIVTELTHSFPIHRM